MSRNLVLMLLLCACAPPLPPLSLELGQGIERFAPLLEGEEVDLVMGPQGGWHLWAGLRVSGLEPAQATQEAIVEITVEHDGELDQNRLRPAFHAVDERLEAAGLTGIVHEPDRVRGRDVVLGARLTVDGRQTEDARAIKVRP
jgi:hypothetical protein